MKNSVKSPYCQLKSVFISRMFENSTVWALIGQKTALASPGENSKLNMNSAPQQD